MEKMVADLVKGGNNQDGDRDELNRNILLETFDNIRDDLRRGEHLFALKVRIVCGRQIQGSNVSPKVCILFKKHKRWTQRETNSTNEPFWGESFYFNCVTDVESLLRENITFRVVNSRMFRRNLVIGEFQLSLVLVAGEKHRSMFNRWLALVDPNDPATVCKGFLKVCVALMFPNEPEVQWPDPLAYNSAKEDTETAVLTCSGQAFLKMTFILSVFLMQDIPRFDVKGRKVSEIALGLSFAGKTVTSERLSLPDDIVSEPYQIKKELRLTVAWPSMCNKLNFNLFSINGRERTPLCCHSFAIRDISVESSSCLKRNIRSEDPEAPNRDLGVEHLQVTQAQKREPAKDESAKKEAKRKTKPAVKEEGFMPMIGPCFVNMYGAPLDLFEDKVEPSYIEKMNSGEIEGCAYRGRMFVRLRSEFCDANSESTDVRDLHLGAKEQRDLLSFAKSNTFLLFGMISTVPLVSDARSTIQFELSIGHSGINSMCAMTKSQPYPSTSFSINPKEILKAQRILSGHSYSTLTLDNEKPAFLIESSWEDIRYRLHFYNYIVSLESKWEKSKNLIVMSFKLGLSRERVLTSIRNLCHDMQQCMTQTPIPSSSSTEAGMNDMDKQWLAMRYQQLKAIYSKLGTILRCAISYSSGVPNEISKVARILCEKLPDISLLFDNIKKEPQLSIPDIFIYLLVNNERRAYARLPAASIYYCQADAVHTNPVDAIGNPKGDYSRYRGSMANRVETIFLKTIPGLRGYSEDEYWPIPGMIRMRLLFGLTSTLRNGVLPPVKYYGVMYEYTKLGGFLDSVCPTGQKGDTTNFKTDSSGINIVESSSNLLRAKPTHDRDGNHANWRWMGGWLPWPDVSVLVNSSAETAFDFVYMVHVREKAPDRGKSAAWNFIGYFTEDMDRIVAAGNRLDTNFAMDTNKWMVITEKDPLTEEQIGWVEVKNFEEYSKDISFREKDITTSVRLESNFARKLLQRKRRRKDVVYTETINITFTKGRDNRWGLLGISRTNGLTGTPVEMTETAIRSWTQLQNLTPMSYDFIPEQNSADVRAAGEGSTDSRALPSRHSLKTFKWIDDWQEQMLPLVSEDKKTVVVTYERRKILSDIIDSDKDANSGINDEQQRCTEYGASITDSIFHVNHQKDDRVKRVRMRRLIEPHEFSLSLLSTVRDRVVKVAPFPSFMVQRRVGKKSRLCCLFNNIEQIPTPTTVTAMVDTAHISRWEMRCYFHEARDLLMAEHKDQLYVYAILSVSGMSAASSIIQNDFNTQLWRWNETIIFRNLVFHEDVEQVASSPPMVVIEFFRKLPIHNDMFLGRCIVDSENFVVQMEENHSEDRNPVLQWYKVHLRGAEDAGCILAGFHFRHRDTFRPSAKIFENSFLTPPEKSMVDLFKQDRVVLDNRKRFEIPAEILPVLVPHVLKITSWGLRELRKFMLARVAKPTIEFRIGHNVLQTESLDYDKSPNFMNKSHSLLIYLPLEVSYLPDLFLVVRDARAFGRAPLIGVVKIPLHICRFKDTAHLDELDPEETDFFLDTLLGRIQSHSKSENNTYKRMSKPLMTDYSREFYYLFESPPQFPFGNPDMRDVDDTELQIDDGADKSFLNRLKHTMVNMFLSTGARRSLEEPQNYSSDYRMVLGDETLSKTKPDWWCKYYLSKTGNLSKAINYLEGDKLEFYYSKLEDAMVQIGDPNYQLHPMHRFSNVCRALSSGLWGSVEEMAVTQPGGSADNEESRLQRLHEVQYGGFDDVFEMIKLKRCKQLTSDEEGRSFGIFLGKVRLYFLGALMSSHKRDETLEGLYRSKTRQRNLPYTPLYSSLPKEVANQDCLVRVYLVRALELQAGNMASLPNSYVEVFIADNNKETQLSSSKAQSIEMDSNPVYGRMFELYCIVPFQTRLRVRVMDKSSFLFDEEIGSTTIDLEKRMTTVYRATCGLQQSYRQAGINAWRDMQKPSEILKQVCYRFGLYEPLAWEEKSSEEVDEDGHVLTEGKPLHRYSLFPPGFSKKDYAALARSGGQNEAQRGLSGYRRHSRSHGAANSIGFGDTNDPGVPPPPEPENLTASGALYEMLMKRQDNGNKTDLLAAVQHGDGKLEEVEEKDQEDDDGDPQLLDIRRKVQQGRLSSPEPKEVIFRLEDFDAISESRGIHLGPNDGEPEICRERLALNILRRLPLVREHVETRPLYNPLQPDMVQGRLEMWVDIFGLSGLPNSSNSSNSAETRRESDKQAKAEEIISKVRELLPPPVNVSPREPQPYELRVVVWSVHEVITETDYGSSGTGDLYVRAWMEGLGDTQETDVHYNSLEGEGEFNWRFVFQLDYLPHERTICGKQKVSLFNRVLSKIPPMLHIQLWDNRRFRFDDFVGSVELDLSKLAAPARNKDSCFMRQRWVMDLDPAQMEQNLLAAKSVKTEDMVNLFEVQRIYGYWPLSTSKSHALSDNKAGVWMVGKLLMELEMLSKEEAALKPAGLGRGEPNQNPKLPNPQRLSVGNSFWSTSLAAFRKVFWPNYKWYCIGGVLMIVFVAMLVTVVVQVPMSTFSDTPRSS